jgi:murein DD-endopeptidase MepM/ murein hydrolase activator NlpD
VRDSGTHGGIDLADSIGTPIFAALGGTVTYAGKDPRGGYGPDRSTGPNGIYVSINHADSTTTKYLHLDTFVVSTGAAVEQGQHIGTLGNTGRSYGPHLHLHTYDSSGAVINPIDWMTSHPDATFPVQVAADE